MSGLNPETAAGGSMVGPRGLVSGKEKKKKAGGGVLNRLKARRQAPHHAVDDGLGAVVTEQELLALDTIRPEHVLRLGRVTESECGARRVVPSRRTPGPLQPPAEPAFRPLHRPGVHLATLPSTAGRAALPTAPPGRACALHSHLHLAGKRFFLSLTAFPWVRPLSAPPGFPLAGPSWALRLGRSPLQLHVLGEGAP